MAATFAEAGVPKEEVEQALVWAIGEDFHRILIRYWPHRIRERIKLDIKESDKIKDGIAKVAKAWRERNDSGTVH